MKKKNRENDGLFCTSVVLNYTSFLFPTQGRKKKKKTSILQIQSDDFVSLFVWLLCRNPGFDGFGWRDKKRPK